MKKTTIASLISLAFTSHAFAVENINLDDVLVSASRFERRESETTYASEIHTAKQIEASGAATLYDYLAQQSSLNIGSSYGSKATPSINLRGYGGENGAQNVVIIVDGQRINSIDGVPQLIAAIPLGSIERIEISKGGGSVVYGDGATAGVIQIFTKNKTGVTVSSSFGNYGQQNHFINAGLSEKYFDLSANLAHDGVAGYSNPDTGGNKDKSASDTQNIKLKLKPTADLNIVLEATNSNNDIRYPNALNPEQFDSNPQQNGKPNKPYLQQKIDSQSWRLGASYNITSTINISSNYYKENKNVSYVPSAPYKNTIDAYDLLLSFCNETLSLTGGVKISNGSRDTGSDITSKDSHALFSQAEYRPLWLSDALTVSAGVRNEKVKYQYNPTSGSQLSDDRGLNAWDVGANYRLNSTLSLFTNYNQSFLAPDIDRFFAYDQVSPYGIIFNGFIQPQKVRTLNLGVNHTLENNRFKATAFYSNLNNEIFLDKTIDTYGTNRNINQSHKYGLELNDYFAVNGKLSLSGIYNYVVAVVDNEVTDSGAMISNKILPGSPKHNLVLNVNYKFYENATLNLNQTLRSGAYAYDDFQNNFTQKQGIYQTTNVALNYQYKNMNFFTSINNLFAHENSIQVTNDAMYPVDFVRTWRVGMKADF